jgi:hypothetical protein
MPLTALLFTAWVPGATPRIVNPQVWLAYAKRFEQTFGFRPQG